ncbi:hypothetical protein FRC10_010432 [Ceratobasidium sp. 414]|nr:hypothetical protein FRC10_010432 [Ceratobasidium sp. 414]
MANNGQGPNGTEGNPAFTTHANHLTPAGPAPQNAQEAPAPTQIAGHEQDGVAPVPEPGDDLTTIPPNRSTMSSTSSHVGQTAGNAESTPNHVASEGNPTEDTQAEIDSAPQMPTLAPGHATPNEQPEVHLTPPPAEVALPPEHAQAAVPAPDPEPALPDHVNDDAISPLMKAAGGIQRVLDNVEDEND